MSNANNITKFFNDNDISKTCLAWDDWDSDEQQALVVTKFGNWKVVADERHPLDPEQAYIIFQFEKLDTKVGLFGYYSSYEGTMYDDDFTEVAEESKAVSYYVPRKGKV